MQGYFIVEIQADTSEKERTNMKHNKKPDKYELARRRLKAARAALGYTQAEVAEVLGVASSTVCKWETNIYAVNVGDIVRLCELLEISISDLFA